MTLPQGAKQKDEELGRTVILSGAKTQALSFMLKVYVMFILSEVNKDKHCYMEAIFMKCN